MDREQRLHHIKQLRQAVGEVTDLDGDETHAWLELASILSSTTSTKNPDNHPQMPARYKRLAENIPGVVYQYLQRGGEIEDVFVYISPSVRDLYGLDPESVMQDSDLMWKAVHLDDREGFAQSLALAAERGERWNWEWRITTPEGQTRWVKGTASQEHQTDGSLLWDGLILDITDLKQAAIDLAGSEAKYRNLVENISEVFYLLDMEGIPEYTSPSVERLLGYTPSELKRCSFLEYVHPDDRERMALAFAQLLREGVSTDEFRVRARSGDYLWVQVSNRSRYEGERLTGIQGVMTDITERKQQEADLRSNEERFRTVFHGVFEGIIIGDAAGEGIILANQSMAEMLGHDPEDLEGMGPRDIHPEDRLDEIRAIILRLLAGELNIGENIPLERKDGSVFYADVSLRPIILRGQQRILLSFRDISERQKLKTQLAQADRLANIGMLAAGVAHEINNPLSYVVYNLKCLENEIPKLAQITRDCMEMVQRSNITDPMIDDNRTRSIASRFEKMQVRMKNVIHGTDRIQNVTLSLGSFSRTRDEIPEPVELHQVVDTVTSIMNNEVKYRAQLIKDYHADLPKVLANESRLSQVLLNLLINATHAIDEGGKEHNEIRILSWYDAENVCVQVRDTGCGIAPENIPSLFDPFFSTKKIGEGSGLGLAISHSIIQEHGGTLEVESKLGVGSAFTIRLPIPTSEESTAKIKPISSAAPGVCGRILIVDDEPHILEVMAEILSDYETVLAGSGIEAKEILENEQDFDAILCDLMMADITGTELHAWLKSSHPDLADQVIFVTGGAFTPNIRSYIDEVDNPKLKKPLDVKRFRKVVSEHIGRLRSCEVNTDG